MTPADYGRLAELEETNSRLRMEDEFPKQAGVFFAREQGQPKGCSDRSGEATVIDLSIRRVADWQMACRIVKVPPRSNPTNTLLSSPTASLRVDSSRRSPPAGIAAGSAIVTNTGSLGQSDNHISTVAGAGNRSRAVWVLATLLVPW